MASSMLRSRSSYVFLLCTFKTLNNVLDLESLLLKHEDIYRLTEWWNCGYVTRNTKQWHCTITQETRVEFLTHNLTILCRSWQQNWQQIREWGREKLHFCKSSRERTPQAFQVYNSIWQGKEFPHHTPRNDYNYWAFLTLTKED